jgi:hypothetical protein
VGDLDDTKPLKGPCHTGIPIAFGSMY